MEEEVEFPFMFLLISGGHCLLGVAKVSYKLIDLRLIMFSDFESLENASKLKLLYVWGLGAILCRLNS